MTSSTTTATRWTTTATARTWRGQSGRVGNNAIGVAGVNWQIQIMGLKFLDSGGSGTTSAAVSALNYATMMRNNYGVNIRLTNNSWGGGFFFTGPQ